MTKNNYKYTSSNINCIFLIYENETIRQALILSEIIKQIKDEK